MRTGINDGVLHLDKLDLMLIQAIEQNARDSYKTLATKVGTSPQTARRRLDRLIDQGIIRIAAIPDYNVLGYNTLLTLAINTAPGTLDALVEQLINANSIKYLWITAGRYDILAVAMYSSTEEYLRLFPKEMSDIPENVRIEVMQSIKVVKSSWTHLTDNDAVIAPHSEFIPTGLDLSVIKGLGESPRAPVTELAQKIGANPSSVRFSLNKLLSQGMVQIVGVTDPTAFGYKVRGVTLIQVHPSKLEALTNQLKASPSVKQIALILGAFNCMIWTSFQDSNQMRHFLVQDLGNMPGVIHYESLILLGTQKASFNLVGEK